MKTIGLLTVGAVLGAVGITLYYVAKALEFMAETGQLGELDDDPFAHEPPPDDPEWFDWAHDLGLI